METNTNYAAVGAFVIFLTLSMILAIIWLSSGFSFERYVNYMVFMKESVSGLNVDGPVEFNGVNVGSVSTIRISKKNPQLVELLLSIKSSTPITQGTVATLASRGVTGTSYISLLDKSTDLRPLVVHDDEPYPVIKTAPSLFVRLDTFLTKFAKSFDLISKTFENVFDEENLKSLKGVLLNMESITKNMSDNNARLTDILTNTSTVTRQFIPLINTTTSTFQTLQTQTLPATYEVIHNLQEITRSLSAVSKDVRDNPSVLVRGVKRQPLGPGE